MEELSKILRTMQFYTHIAHNLTSGDTFFSDHAFLGDLYAAYEVHYDDVVERMIGLGMPIDLPAVHLEAAKAVSTMKTGDAQKFFKEILSMEKSLVVDITDAIEGNSEGTSQLLGEICNQSEMRQYKLKQRLA